MSMESNKKIIVLTGGTGFVGTALTVSLLKRGYLVRILTRDKNRYEDKKSLPVEYFSWDPISGLPPSEALEGAFGVIHLAGEPVAGTRWTQNRKSAILKSRTLGTQNLVLGLEKLKEKPSVLIGTSAIGYYGDRENEELSESSELGRGFLPEVCRQWEEETLKAQLLLRVAVIRVGIVLGTDSGALGQMLPIFRMGLGGPLGSGTQWMSWIHLQDLVDLYIFVLENNTAGIINGVAPNPVSNRIFTRALSQSLGRPAFFPAPKAAIKIAFGEMATIILSSQKVSSTKALDIGFKFNFPNIENALNDLLSPLGIKGAYTLKAYHWLKAPRERVFDFFSEAANLETLTPDWLNFKIEKVSDPKITKNTLIYYKLKVRGIPIRWKTLIEEFNSGNFFVDRMLKGPYKNWHHTHTFSELEGGTLIYDQVYYTLPAGIIGNFVALIWVTSDILKIFNFRKTKISEIFKT